ncbi:MAG: hypothetical protein M9949_06190 [Candidatus Kapabacteria bacterium]|nr:hypothetical protein [Candidatus Kapabacteria bacterium]
MEFITDFFNNNIVLFGFVALIVITFVGIMVLQWFKKKTGVNTDALVDGLKDLNETAQVETAKELKKTVERILTKREAILSVKEGNLVEIKKDTNGNDLFIEHTFPHVAEKTLDGSQEHETYESSREDGSKVTVSIDGPNGETQTFETGPDESVTIIGKTKNKYAVRDSNGKFVKADETTEKRKVGRPRKVKQ